MTQQQVLSDGKEIWESTVPGRISVTVTDERGRETTESVLGKGKRLRLRALDRQINEERIRDEQNNPFTNGMLICINRPTVAAGDGEPEVPVGASDNELSDDDLAGLFDLDVVDFEPAVQSLTEVNVRRLKMLAVERDAKASQIGFINDYIQEKWPVGKDTPTYREITGRPANAI